jgi:hypothetical protein
MIQLASCKDSHLENCNASRKCRVNGNQCEETKCESYLTSSECGETCRWLDN